MILDVIFPYAWLANEGLIKKLGEINLIMGNKQNSAITMIGEFDLKLSSEVKMNLVNYNYSFEMSRNIIYFYELYRPGFQFFFLIMKNVTF